MGCITTYSGTVATRVGCALKSLVLALAGSIGSGKSTLAQGVSRTLSWPYVSFGDYVRAVAQRQGLPLSREVLQSVGAALIKEGWEQFCQAVLAQANWKPGQSLVVDGIRHVEAIDTLGCLVAPSKLLLVLITLDQSTREARLRGRGITHESLQILDAHPSEAQVQALLPQRADMILDGAKPVETLLQDIVTWIQQYQEPRVG